MTVPCIPRPVALIGLLLSLIIAAPGAQAQQDRAVSSLAARAAHADGRHTNIPRKVLAFYYPWYGNAEVTGGSGRWSHWEGVDVAAKRIRSSTHFPELGPYDSLDYTTIARHAQWSKRAGLDGWIVSWWGKDAPTDQPMAAILDAGQKFGLDITVYYEVVPHNDPQIAFREILDVLQRYGKHPAWLRINGRPVVFVYGRALENIGLDAWRSVDKQLDTAYPGGVILMGGEISAASARVFDGVHYYVSTEAMQGMNIDQITYWARMTYPGWVKVATARGRISTITVMPGYDDTKIRHPGHVVSRFDGRSYRAQWEAAIAASPDWILVTSFNEWHEGSEIEPSVEFGEKYIELTAEFAARFKQPPVRKP